MRDKKGQAAMEFLMTYGWAILAAVIAIGVLAYFGVFSPGKYVTGNAVVNPPFYITAANAKASSGVTLAVKNNGGEDYTIKSVSITNCGSMTNNITFSVLKIRTGGISGMNISVATTLFSDRNDTTSSNTF